MLSTMKHCDYEARLDQFEVGAAAWRGPEQEGAMGRPSSGPLDGFAIASSHPSDTRAIDGREGLQMALGHIPYGPAEGALTQPAVAFGR